MKDMKAERDRQIAELWLACYTEEEIAEKVGVDQATVNRTMEEPCKADTWQKCMIFSAYSDPSWQPPLSQMSGSDTSSVAFGAPTPAWGRLSRRRDNLSWARRTHARLGETATEPNVSVDLPAHPRPPGGDDQLINFYQLPSQAHPRPPGQERQKLDLTKRERCGIIRVYTGGHVMATTKLTVTLDEELRRAAHEKSERTGRSISHVVREALRHWVEEDPPEEQPKKP